MAAYGKIETTFWQNPRARQVSERGRFLLIYLFTCPHKNVVGCYRLPAGYVQDDLQWDAARVSVHMAELVEHGFIEHDVTRGVVRIIGWWGHNTIENKNVAIAAAKAVENLPNSAIRNNAIKAIHTLGSEHIKPIAHRFKESIETHPIPVAHGFPTPEPYPEPEPDSPELATQAPPPEGAGPSISDPPFALKPDEPDDDELPMPTCLQRSDAAQKAAAIVADFDAWWPHVPRKVGKGHARKAYRLARRKPGVDAATLLSGVMRWAAEATNQDPQFVKHPATWLGAEGWLDEPAKPGATNGHRNHTAAPDFAEQLAANRRATLRGLGLADEVGAGGGSDNPGKDRGPAIDVTPAR